MAFHFFHYILQNNKEKVLLDLENHKSEVNKSQKGLKPPDYPKRKKINEKELAQVINNYLDKGTFSSPSPLLKHLRNKGIAVEQKRFHRAFWLQQNYR